MNSLFSPKQWREIKYDLEYKPFHIINEGAIATGKTKLNNFLWLRHVNEFRDWGIQFTMTGKTLGTLQRNVLDELAADYCVDVRLDRFNRFKLFGNTINCFGTDTRESWKGITGFTSFGWYANEITHTQEECTNESFGRLRGKGARIFCNPDAPNHYVKKNFIDQSQFKEIHSVHWILEDNSIENGGFLPPEFITREKRNTPAGVFYERKILGLWTSAEGMIYKDWNPDIMVVDKLPQIKRYFAGVDWGFEHLGAIIVIGEDHDGNYYLVLEIAEAQRNIDWWLEQKKKIKDKFGIMPFYCDSARPEYVEAFSGIDANKAVIEGIEHLAGIIKKKKFFVLKNECPEFMREIYLYQWDVRANKEQPKKENDDVLDSIRYAIHTDKTNRTDPNNAIVQSYSIDENFNY